MPTFGEDHGFAFQDSLRYGAFGLVNERAEKRRGSHHVTVYDDALEFP